MGGRQKTCGGWTLTAEPWHGRRGGRVGLIESDGSEERLAAKAGNRPRATGAHLALQGLRAAAALLVVLDHGLVAAADSALLGRQYLPWAPFVGLLGVCVFFTISGVVMMLGHGEDFGRPGAPQAFALRRIVRVVPLYWLATLLVCALRPETVSLAGFVQSLLFIPHQPIGGPYGWPIYPLGWTLQYEMFFYLLFAIALGFGRRIGLALLAGAILVLALAASAGLLGTETIPAYYGGPVILYFLAGIGIGLAAPAFPERWRPGFGAALASAALALAGACAVAWRAGIDSPAAALALAGSAVLATAACALHGPSAAEGPMRKAAHAMGDATYSIYLSHAFLVFALGHAVAWAGLRPPLFLFLAAGLLASAFFGLALYRWLEKPLVRATGRLIGQRPGIGGRAA